MLKPLPLEDQTPPTRVPPHSFEAERALLGAVLLNNRALDRAREFLEPRHFAEPLHGRIYAACISITDSGRIASAITISEALGADPDLTEQGGNGYLARLVGGAATIINALDYATLIYDLHLRRELIAFGEDVTFDAFTPELGTDAGAMLAKAEEGLEEIYRQHGKVSGHRPGGLRGPQAYLPAVVKSVEAAEFRQPGELLGLPTGLVDLDQKMGGMLPSDLIILAGRPSSGKTALAVTALYNVARRAAHDGAQRRAAMFSLEMTGEQIWSRIMAYESDIDTWTQRNGPVTATDRERFGYRAQGAREFGLFIDDSSNPSMGTIRKRCETMRRTGRLDLVVIDYLQLMGGTKKAENRNLEIGEITRGLKQIAKDLDVPMVALSQLSRQVEARDDKRPLLSDLRDSGSIEQDADVVLLLYREWYYLQNAEPRRKSGEKDDAFAERLHNYEEALKRSQHVAELNVAKNRQGPTGSCRLYFDDARTWFGSLQQGGG